MTGYHAAWGFKEQLLIIIIIHILNERKLSQVQEKGELVYHLPHVITIGITWEWEVIIFSIALFMQNNFIIIPI